MEKINKERKACHLFSMIFSYHDNTYCREKGYYSNFEVLEEIIRSRFSGTATCVGNPGLRQGDDSTLEVSLEGEDCRTVGLK